MGHFGNHDHDVKRDVYLTELRRLGDVLGRTPTGSDMEEHGRFSRGPYKRFFESWNVALEAAGFEVNTRTDITNEELLDALRKLSDELDRTPSYNDMEERGEFAPSTYENRFGSWNTALKEAGIELNNQWGMPDEELLEELRRLANVLDRTPTQPDMTEYGRYSIRTYALRFGNWNGAIEAAGLDPTRRYDISDEELLEELRQLTDRIERTPTSNDMVAHGEFSLSIYIDRFVTWNSALEEAGFEQNHRQNIPRDELIDDIHRLVGELGGVPVRSDIDDIGRFSSGIYRARFGSWNAALEEAGLEPRRGWANLSSGEEHPRWTGGTFPYGPGWNDEKKEQVRERDGRKCQHCGRDEERHLELAGKKHSVHHIQKARHFDNPDHRNHLDNLVTLCSIAPKGGDIACHDVWEGMSPLRPHVVHEGTD